MAAMEAAKSKKTTLEMTVTPLPASTPTLWTIVGATLRAALRNSSDFAGSRRASAAVEFAIILPVALILYVGATDVTRGVMANRKVAVLTRTLVDLASQQPTAPQGTTPTPANAITAATLSTLMTSAGAMMYPLPTSTLQMTLSAVDLANTSAGVCCTATVRWSYTQGGTLRPCGKPLTSGTNGSTNQPASLPASLMPAGTPLPGTVSVLIADVSYAYVPLMGTSILNFAPTMARNEYMFPRTTGQLFAGTLPATGAQYGTVCY